MSLTITKLNYHNPDHGFILKEISLHAKCGQITAIVGPSGSGKSTLVKVIAGLYQAANGSIKFSHQELGKTTSYQRQIGYVSQNPSLLPHLTIYENLKLARRGKFTTAAKEELLSLLKKVRLSQYKDSYPHQLSIGQQQKIAILRAIFRQPKMILFDEPYANLDLIV